MVSKKFSQLKEKFTVKAKERMQVNFFNCVVHNIFDTVFRCQCSVGENVGYVQSYKYSWFVLTVSRSSYLFLSALPTVAPVSLSARRVPFRPASPRRRRKHRKRISKAAIRAMIM